MKQAEKLDYLDGLKVLACLMVFNFHFINLFYPGAYSLLPEHFHTEAVEYWFGSTPLNIIAGAKFAVRIFLAVSGFLVGYRFFLTGEKHSLKTGVIKKYFRLVLPIMTVSILIFILMSLGAYQNHQASVLAGSEIFSGNYNTFSPSLPGALKEALWGCFVTGENQYNGPVWFIHYEFFGTLLVAAILSLLGESRARYIVYGICAVLFIRSDFLSFILGAVVCDLTYQPPKWFVKIFDHKWISLFLLIAGLFLGSFPPIGERLEGTIYAPFPIKVMFYYNVGAAMLLYGLLHLKGPEKILSSKIFTWYTPFTYGFYLVHFPVLCTFSSKIFLLLESKMNYHMLAVLNYALTLVVITGISCLLHEFAEKPGIKLAGKISAYFDKN